MSNNIVKALDVNYFKTYPNLGGPHWCRWLSSSIYYKCGACGCYNFSHLKISQLRKGQIYDTCQYCDNVNKLWMF